MEIKSIGGGARQEYARAILSQMPVSARFSQVLLLPVPTSRDKKYITGTEIDFPTVAELSGRGTLLVGYGIPKELFGLSAARGAEIYDLATDEEFLADNARLTAYAALGRILSDIPRELSELTVGVVGYGRIGSRLVSLLLFLGARLRVYTRRESVRLELCEMGIGAELISDESDFSDIDLLINTAPTRVMSDERFFSLPEGLMIIELASGKNFPTSDRVRALPSLPERVYPVSASRIYTECVRARIYGEVAE